MLALLQQEQQRKLSVTRVRIVLEALEFVPLPLVVLAPPPQARLAAPQMELQRVTRALPTRTLLFRDPRVTVIALPVRHVQLATHPLQVHLLAMRVARDHSIYGPEE